MGKITKEIDLALKNTVHLLNTISRERIRDEFLKGINTSTSKVKYFNTLSKYGLWKWIFGDLKVNQSFYFDYKHYIVILSLLLDGNNIGELKKRLVNEFKYSILEVNHICFFLRFKSEMSIKNVFKLKTEYNRLKIKDGLFYEYCKSTSLNMEFVNKFMNFNLTVSGDDLIKQGYKGKEVGRIKEELENQNFLNH